MGGGQGEREEELLGSFFLKGDRIIPQPIGALPQWFLKGAKET